MKVDADSQAKKPKILRKFEQLTQRQKPLYKKAYAFIKATTHVLMTTVKDTSATAYFASISQVILASSKAKDSKGPDMEMLAYCYAAVISSLDLAVIQNQHAVIADLIKTHLLSASASEYTCKYGVIALQFLLHSKTQTQWQAGADRETEELTNLMMTFLVDHKRKKAQKQAIKSMCLMLKNRSISKQPVLLNQIQLLVSQTFITQDSTFSAAVENQRQIQLLHFLSAGLQVMPGQICCDTATMISKLIDGSPDEQVKTTAYLTLEVLYASRRLSEFGDHIETLLRHLLESPELPDVDEITDEDRSNKQANQRIIAYIQATSQIVLNYASNESDQSEFMQKQILRYVTLACSVFCEYLAGSNFRIQRAGFSAIRLIIAHGCKQWLFKAAPQKGKKKEDGIMELLKFDALTLSEEVKNVRQSSGAAYSSISAQDKIVIHMCYLLTTRFEHVYDLVMRLVKTFIENVGSCLKGQQCQEFLIVVSQLKFSGKFYSTWEDCLGSFLKVMGTEAFFRTLPLRVCEFNMNSLTYAQDSRSYLIQIVKQKLPKADMVFFTQNLIPIINDIDALKVKSLQRSNPDYSIVKAKKYETLIVQIWELLPIFCRQNSPQLAPAFSSLLQYLEPMVNKNVYGLRSLALRSFSELINHCRNTRAVTDQIKKTRKGLQNICLQYVDGLSKMYCILPDEANQHNALLLTQQERVQVLRTLQDFASIAKSGTFGNKFLTSFSELVAQKESRSVSNEQILLNLDVLIAMMEKVKLNKENQVALMLGVKAFVQDRATQKKGYKILTRVVERIDLQSFDELVEIKTQITPMMSGQATKQRLQLIVSFITAAKNNSAKEADKEQTLKKVIEFFRPMIIELIQCFNSSNLKTRKLSEEAITKIASIMSDFGAIPQLLYLMLVGLAGSTPQTQSCTIRALIFVMKKTLKMKQAFAPVDEEKKDEFAIERLISSDQSIQEFLRKVTKIIALFLKDSTAPKELTRSVLKYVKIVISFLRFDNAETATEMTELILTHVFYLSSVKRFTMMIRRILGKLIARVGLQAVTRATSKENQKLIDYIERARRKRKNATERTRMLHLLGKDPSASVKASDQLAKPGELESDDDLDSEGLSDGGMDVDDVDGSDQSESSDSDDEHEDGVDTLPSTHGIDIPAALNIPVVSLLAKAEKSKPMDSKKMKEVSNKKITDFIEEEDENLETHFVENPYIKLKRATQKALDSKNNLGADDLIDEEDTTAQDVIMLKEDGKIVVKDFEQMDVDKAKAKLLKRKHLEMTGYGSGEDMPSSDDEDNLQAKVSKAKGMWYDTKREHGKVGSHQMDQIHKMQGQSATKIIGTRRDDLPGSHASQLRKRDAKLLQAKQKQGGHFVKASQDAYKSKKGKGDVLKAGQHEPYAYIKLNPEMLNPRKKKEAINSFAGLVSHGKKLDKRTGKKADGMLSGLTFKNQKE